MFRFFLTISYISIWIQQYFMYICIHALAFNVWNEFICIMLLPKAQIWTNVSQGVVHPYMYRIVKAIIYANFLIKLQPNFQLGKRWLCINESHNITIRICVNSQIILKQYYINSIADLCTADVLSVSQIKFTTLEV